MELTIHVRPINSLASFFVKLEIVIFLSLSSFSFHTHTHHFRVRFNKQATSLRCTAFVEVQSCAFDQNHFPLVQGMRNSNQSHAMITIHRLPSYADKVEEEEEEEKVAHANT